MGAAGRRRVRCQPTWSRWRLVASAALSVPSRKPYPVGAIAERGGRSCRMALPNGSCEAECGADHPDISLANEIPGSQTGSQRPQTPGDARPRPAILAAAGSHVRPHRAASGDVGKVPPKQ